MNKKKRYHKPVMLKKSISSLMIKPNGIYLDLTFGGGSHSKEILSKLKSGKLISFDRDPDSIHIAKLIQHSSFIFINNNFKFIKSLLKDKIIGKIDGIIADLGTSSYQLDNPRRGFSIKKNSLLDMRLNQLKKNTAAGILNQYDKNNLKEMFIKNSNIINNKLLIKYIIIYRFYKKINTTNDLIKIISKISPKKNKFKYYAKIFQAIRMESNNELESLTEMIKQSVEILKKNGRLVVISYHSLEDRVIKNFFKKGNFLNKIKKDFYGNKIRPFDPINQKPILPSIKEVKNNNRSKNAKLRIAKKR